MVALVAIAAVVSMRANIREDIGALLPDDRSAAGRDFALFSGTQLARRVLVSLSAAPGVSEEVLAAAADKVEAMLAPPLFSPPPPPGGPAELAALLPRALPAMATAEDLARLRSFSAETVAARVTAAYALLLSPEGMGAKGFLRADPLASPARSSRGRTRWVRRPARAAAPPAPRTGACAGRTDAACCCSSTRRRQ